MGATVENTSPIFVGAINGKLTQFTNATGTTETDIYVGDATDATRVDILTVTTDDIAVTPNIVLYMFDGTNDLLIGNIICNRSLKSVGTYTTLGTITIAATTITRSSGSWMGDGYKLGDTPVIYNAPDAANNKTCAAITTITDTVLTMSGETLTARAACYGHTIGLPEASGVTNILNSMANLGLAARDGANNPYIDVPAGWKIRAKLVTAPTSGKIVNVQVRGGKY